MNSDGPSSLETPPAAGAKPAAPPLDRGVLAIVAFKAFFGALYLAVSVGVFSFMNQDLAALAQRLVDAFNLDPGNHVLLSALAVIPSITPGLLRTIAVGTFLYGSLEMVQAVGLWFEQIWADWLIVVATMLLIPVEGYEIYHHASLIKVGVLVLNLVIVWYLYTRHIKSPAARKPSRG